MVLKKQQQQLQRWSNFNQEIEELWYKNAKIEFQYDVYFYNKHHKNKYEGGAAKKKRKMMKQRKQRRKMYLANARLASMSIVPLLSMSPLTTPIVQGPVVPLLSHVTPLRVVRMMAMRLQGWYRQRQACRAVSILRKENTQRQQQIEDHSHHTTNPPLNTSTSTSHHKTKTSFARSGGKTSLLAMRKAKAAAQIKPSLFLLEPEDGGTTRSNTPQLSGNGGGNGGRNRREHSFSEKQKQSTLSFVTDVQALLRKTAMPRWTCNTCDYSNKGGDRTCGGSKTFGNFGCGAASPHHQMTPRLQHGKADGFSTPPVTFSTTPVTPVTLSTTTPVTQKKGVRRVLSFKEKDHGQCINHTTKKPVEHCWEKTFTH